MIIDVKEGEVAPVLEVIADYACEIGENPLWHPPTQRLYWTDIPGGSLFCFDPRTGKHRKFYEGRPVGGFTFQVDGSLLLFRDRGSIASWRDGHLTELIPEVKTELDSRFNDVIADPAGRIFCGSMSTTDHQGRLYRLNLDGTINTVLDDVGCSNGMGFTPDRRGFYYTDSFAGEIYLFDYEVEDGSIGNRRVFASIPKGKGLPDGLTVDSEGCVWTALWNGWSILRFLPSGQLDRILKIPARKVSSLTFGGPDCSDIYITTAGGTTKSDDGKFAGALFRLRAWQVKGAPEFLSRIKLRSFE